MKNNKTKTAKKEAKEIKNLLDIVSKISKMTPGEVEKDYKARMIGRVEPADNRGLGVSTAYTKDFGYETAILDAYGPHPVERYKTKEKALEGHNRWVKYSTEITKIIELGGSMVPNRIVNLVPEFDEKTFEFMRSLSIKTPGNQKLG